MRCVTNDLNTLNPECTSASLISKVFNYYTHKNNFVICIVYNNTTAWIWLIIQQYEYDLFEPDLCIWTGILAYIHGMFF